MRRMTILAIIFTLFATLALPSTALARGLFEDKIVFGGSYTLASGETLDGNLVVLGGNALLEQGSTVNGDVILMGGNLEANGSIEGNVVGLGGLVSLGGISFVKGDVTMIGAQLDKADGARVEGRVITSVRAPLTFTFPGGVQVPRFGVNVSPELSFIGFFLKVLVWAALAVLVVLFLPEHTRRVGQTTVSQPLISGGLGLLTVVVLPVLMLALIVTILLIPVSLLVAALAVLAWMFGLIALGLEVGKRLAELFKREWAPAAAAGAGTFVLILVLNGIREVVPCVGWVAPALAGMVGLGAVLLTRFGMQVYPPVMLAPVVPPPPDLPAPPPPPDLPEPPAPPTPPEPPQLA